MVKMVKKDTICELRGQVYNGTHKKRGENTAEMTHFENIRFPFGFWQSPAAFINTHFNRGVERDGRACALKFRVTRVPRRRPVNVHGDGQRPLCSRGNRGNPSKTGFTSRATSAPLETTNQGRMISGGPNQRRFRDTI